jgi:hypothetical protein
MTMADKNEGQGSLGQLFVREFVKASSWGIVLLISAVIFLLGAKQNIKEAIDFSLKRAVGEVYFSVSNPEVKQDIKEAIEFLSEQSNRQVKMLLADPAFKQDVKEAIDLWYAYKYKKLQPTGKIGGT